MNRMTILKQLGEVEGKLQQLRVALERLPEERRIPRNGVSKDDQLQKVRFLDKRLFSQLIDDAFATMHIHGVPMGAEKVQALIAASGVSPDANILSHSLIEMREE